MGMLDWFKGFAREGNRTTAASIEEEGADIAGLSFRTSVDVHMKWKARLEDYINGGRAEELKVETVSRDDQCQLGKWIYDEGGEQFGFSETFFDMKAHHAHFHRCAGAVLAAAQSGNTALALRLLHGSDYTKASERVKMLLARMFTIAAEGKEAIDSHTRWKERLSDYIKGKSREDLKVEIMSADDQCPLGQWLNAIGRERFEGRPAFEELRFRHTHFHRCAGEVLSFAQQGEKEMALHMLEEGAYPEASDQVAAAIVALFGTQKDTANK